MAHTCPACQHNFESDALAGVVCCPRCACSFDAHQDQTIATSKQQDSSFISEHDIINDRYVLKRKIGQGGMAEVWLVADKQSEQDAVIKLLLPHVAQNEQICKRFDREIESLRRFTHANIIPVSDHGQYKQRPYYVTPCYAKHSLRHYISEQHAQSAHISLSCIKQITTDCLHALQHAHQQHIIHRDIKPENILALHDGSYALGDFGIAQVHSTHDGDTLTMLTNTNVVLGTYAYMAPEQSKGSRNVDGRADLYALGVVLYECISGHLPEGRFEDPALFLKHWPKADRERWNEFILQLLERDPNRRFRNADAALAAINAATVEAVPVDDDGDPFDDHYPHKNLLYRDSTHAWLGGVCSGLGSWCGIDASWIRLALCIGLLYSARILFIVYIAAVLIMPACPDTYYKPRPLNNGLPRRGDGWFLGVCEMLGKRSGSPALWRLIFVILCPLTGFFILLPYLAIGIIFPPSLHYHNNRTKRHVRKEAVAPMAVPGKTTTADETPIKYHSSFFMAFPAALSFAYAAIVLFDQDYVLGSCVAGIALFYALHLHTKVKRTPVNFTGFGSGLFLAGCASLLLFLFSQTGSHNPTLVHDSAVITMSHTSSDSFFAPSQELTLIAALSLIVASIIFGLCRGYYGALGQSLGLIPCAAAIIGVNANPDLTLFQPLLNNNMLALIALMLLWFISAHVSKHILHWVINPAPNVDRQYSLNASIIGVTLIALVSMIA